MKRTYPGWLATLALLAGLSGCGTRLHPVEGQLVWADGKPATELEGGMVFFESSEHRSISRSLIQADGRFQLTTLRPGGDGVPPGLHRIYVVEPRTGGGESGQPLSPAKMHERFARPDTSGLEMTVPPPSNPVVLKVERAPRRR
ncbi:MAG: hypothetical protein L0Z62_38285 [Gemmataceae bacterium]|nr:hypothetical protein [Gemmataceae bacterium]